MSDRAAAGRPLWVTALLLALSVLMIVVFVLLGNWQVRRLAWKQELIAAVETRAFGPAVALPEHFDAGRHAYLRVAVDGRWLDREAVLVKAVTELGPGYWVMSPMQTGGGILWVNRGFVPADARDPANWSIAQSPVTGLLRPTAQGGTLLERNDPQSGRWVSRDTVALSDSLGLGATLPYFIDADHRGAPAAWPRGGLTILRFSNSHLSYALTWYAMAVLFALGLAYVLRSSRRKDEAD
ncbi:SURF1 family protein [Microbulbifer sp. S227A]|uniref:SURF1 family protein n=1 Tax=Microbulbifer sp. S227A TaxID=3415131 RepID=UPI003C79D1EE